MANTNEAGWLSRTGVEALQLHATSLVFGIERLSIWARA